jgi:hypothetical protein
MTPDGLVLLAENQGDSCSAPISGWVTGCAWSRRSCGFPEIELEQSSQTLTCANLASGFTNPNPHLGVCGLNRFRSPLEGNFRRRSCFPTGTRWKEAEFPKSPFDTPDSSAILRTVSTKVKVHCLATNETKTIPSAEV